MTVAADLADLAAVRIAYVLMIEGIPWVHTTFTPTEITDITGAGWAGTWSDWDDATWTSDLVIGEATVGQSIQLYAPRLDIRQTSVEVTLGDAAFLRFAVGGLLTTAKSAPLAADLDPADTSVTVEPRVGFDATGTIYVGTEAINYGARTNTGGLTTSFSTLTRGRWSAFLKSAGWKPTHRISSVTNAAPVVSTVPRTGLLGRAAALYLCTRQQNGTWSVEGEAQLVTVGRIKSCPVDGARGIMRITFETPQAMLSGDLFAEPWQAPLARGIMFEDWASGIMIREACPFLGTPVNTRNATTLTGTGVRQGWGALDGQKGLLTLVHEQLAAWTVAASALSVWEMVYNPITKRVEIHASTQNGNWTSAPATTDDAIHEIGLHGTVWRMLGFPPGQATTIYSAGGVRRTVEVHRLVRGAWSSGGSSRYQWSLIATEAPVDYTFAVTASTGGASIDVLVEEPQGTWATQPVLPVDMDVPQGTEGFVIVGDSMIAACSYAAGVLSVLRDMTPYFAAWGFQGSGERVFRDIHVGETGRVTCRQVWLERGRIDDMIRRLVYSTGEGATYNGANDVNGHGMGMAVPADLVDDTSFDELGTRIATLFLPGPTRADKVITSVLAVVGAHWIWDPEVGKLAIRKPRFTGLAPGTVTSLTEANKARPDDRPACVIGSDGMINSLTLRSGRGLDGAMRNTTVVENLASITDYGVRRTATIEGFTVGPDDGEVSAWVNAVAGEVLAFMSRPRTSVQRTGNFRLWPLPPCTVVKLDDDAIVDPRTGELGCNDLPGVVVGVEWRLRDLTAEISIVALHELTWDRIQPFAPSALVSSYASSVLTCAAHEYSHSDEAADASHFVAGDIVDIRERSPSDPAAPAEYLAQEVASVSGNDITLTAALVGWDAAKAYVVSYATATSVDASQLDHAFLADSNGTIGVDDDDAYFYGPTPAYPGAISAPTTTDEVVRHPDSVDNDGRPMSAGEWSDYVDDLNNLWGHRMRGPVAREVWASYRDSTMYGPHVAATLLWGPHWCPLFHWGQRTLKAKIYGAANTGTKEITIRVSSRPPDGTLAAPTWDVPYAEDSHSFSSSTLAWSDEIEIDPGHYTDPGWDPPGVWITIIGDVGARLQALTIVEAEE